MTAIRDILAAMVRDGDGWSVDIPADWGQGRTTYGGLSSALALHAAKMCSPDLPPLRSALIAFIGPVAGRVTVSATLLRRGRNAAFVEVSIVSEAGLGYRATFVFMADLPSRLSHDAAPRSPHRAPSADAKLYVGPADFFTGNFAFLDLKEAAGPTEWLRWARLQERDGLDAEVALIAVADALPPAAMKPVGMTAPVSSLSWIVNVLRPRPESAVGGYSSQRMTMWDADGVPVVEAMQGVAVFA